MLLLLSLVWRMASRLAPFEQQRTLIIGEDADAGMLAIGRVIDHKMPEHAAKGLSRLSCVKVSSVGP